MQTYTEKQKIYITYMIHGPGQCVIFPPPTCFGSFRKIPLIRLSFGVSLVQGTAKETDQWQEYHSMTFHDI